MNTKLYSAGPRASYADAHHRRRVFFCPEGRKNRTINSDDMDADPTTLVLVIMHVLAHASESISRVFRHTGSAWKRVS